MTDLKSNAEADFKSTPLPMSNLQVTGASIKFDTLPIKGSWNPCEKNLEPMGLEPMGLAKGCAGGNESAGVDADEALGEEVLQAIE